jgi:HlyD family secretion protein
MNKRRRNWLMTFGLLAALVLAAGFAWRSYHREPQQDRLTLYGNVDVREVRLAFNASEHVDELHAREGEWVQKGQLLGQLHTEVLELDVARAAARVEAQRQALARLRAGSRSEEIQKARSDVRAAEADARAKRLTYERRKALLPRKLIPQEDVDEAKAKADAAQAALHAARDLLDLVLAGARAEDIAASAAELSAREAELAVARQRLKDATLYAPADGIIHDRILEPGDLATPATPVYTLALMDPVWVRTYVPEPSLGKVAPGMRAEVRTDSYPDKVYSGWVGYISPSAEFTPKTVQTPDLRTRLVYQMRVYACDPGNELRLGMPATVTIPLTQPDGEFPGKNPCENS